MRICKGTGQLTASPLDRRYHRQCHVGDGVGVVRARLGQAASQHIGVSDRLDLLDPKLDRQPVKLGKQSIHKANQIRCQSWTKVW